MAVDTTMTMTMMMMKEEAMMEVEAVEAVCGDDCIVLARYPPHLRIHINPRTADIHSHQFVKATIEIRATAQYPNDPPNVDIIGSKGLDEKRQKHLSASLREKTHELASCLMLVALCEEAVEILSSMNHPEGDCPLCLYPLVPEGEHSRSLPFMKLMSCFHCFHRDCIVRWLKWIRKENEAKSRTTSVVSSTIDDENEQISDICEIMGGSTGNCPVCRMVFIAKDIEHALNQDDFLGVNADDEKELSETLLQCDFEKSRRRKFETTLELQQQRGGLIEPPKDNVLFSRLSLHELVEEAEPAANGEAIEQQGRDQTAPSAEEQPGGSSNQSREATSQRHQRRRNSSKQPASGGSRTTSYGGGGRGQGRGQHRHSGMRKHGRGGDSRSQSVQWTGKE